MGHDRLRRNADVRAVLRRGRRTARPLLVVHVIARGDDAPARVAVVASRRVGSAVQRNRAKRVLRAAAAVVPFPAGVDVALVARTATPRASSTAAAAQLHGVMEQMFYDAGSDRAPDLAARRGHTTTRSTEGPS